MEQRLATAAAALAASDATTLALRYGGAVLCVAAAAVAAQAVSPERPALYLLGAAVAASAWLGGRGPGWLAAAAAAATAAYWAPPPDSFWVEAKALPYFAGFVACAVLATMLGAQKHRQTVAKPRPPARRQPAPPPPAGPAEPGGRLVGAARTVRRAPLPDDLRRLESEAIAILREVAAEFRRPVLLYSIGKDSSVLLHLALKAFHPALPPFPLLHVDTTWKFREMIAFRDETARRLGVELIVHTNREGLERGINPIVSGSALHTQVMKTEALKQALDRHGFDAAIGGARRDEEKSRAKERIFSFRNAEHAWDPRAQRPELWHLFNTRLRPGESMRVFPLSNWTELDVWRYIEAESIPVVPLYFAKERPVVARDGTWIMVDDERLPLLPGERPQMRRVRFRTLGCYPLTGAIESDAASVAEIVAELRAATHSERQGRLIDSDGQASMERKKREGYF